MKRVRRPEGLKGPEGLIASVITGAINDAIGAHSDKNITLAWAYINQITLPNGATAPPLPYRRCLDLLGLPDDWRPDPIKQLTVDDLDRIVKRIDDGN